jgi:signal peptidase I
MQTFFFVLPSLIVIAFFITPKKKSLRCLLNVFKVVAILFFIQSVVRIYLYDIYIVSSSSMERTFFKGMIIFVKKNQKENIERNDVVLFRPNWNKKGMCLVKRCIGLPGDTLLISQDTVFCNGERLSFLASYQWSYYLTDSTKLAKIEAVIDREVDTAMFENSDDKFLYLTSQEKEKIQQLLSLQLVRATMPKGVKPHVYPHQPDISNNRDNNPFIYIPKKDDTIALTKENISWYQDPICKENPDIKFKNNEIYLNGTLIRFYTFKQDYYYMMGDNRHFSQDSRYWGFIPKENILGKVVAVKNIFK